MQLSGYDRERRKIETVQQNILKGEEDGKNMESQRWKKDVSDTCREVPYGK